MYVYLVCVCINPKVSNMFNGEKLVASNSVKKKKRMSVTTAVDIVLEAVAHPI